MVVVEVASVLFTPSDMLMNDLKAWGSSVALINRKVLAFSRVTNNFLTIVCFWMSLINLANKYLMLKDSFACIIKQNQIVSNVLFKISLWQSIGINHVRKSNINLIRPRVDIRTKCWRPIYLFYLIYVTATVHTYKGTYVIWVIIKCLPTHFE